MNYPIWDLPASGLLIAFIAIVHVFISHFAVGGGLFLVVTERKARREGDEALLAYVKAHTRFFVLLTLVLGAITGVGIWFTIGLVHPSATSTLINTFVWGWAIEWTFFVIEIAAAMVYFYGWDRLSARTHMAVGWIYFGSAWMSLVVINGILTFMLTPGGWLATGSFWEGILNPTYLPAVLARTFGAMGLAGVYALITSARSGDVRLKEKIAGYAIVRWVAPMAVLLPISLVWTLKASAGAGVPVSEILGAPGGGWWGIVTAVLGGAATGQPIAQLAARLLILSCAAGLVLCAVVLMRRRAYGRPLVASLVACTFVALGAAEWVREDLRKPYVIGGYMFVNGVRLPVHPVPPPPDVAADRHSVHAINEAGVLRAATWTRLPAGVETYEPGARALAEGREVFRLLCASCHTVDGYVAVRPLVSQAPPAALDAMLARLAAPAEGYTWEDRHPRLRTWRSRRMPPFTGTVDERRALAAYLASLGGATPEAIAAFLGSPGATAAAGPEWAEQFYADNCAMCHAPDGPFPFTPNGRTAAVFHELLGRLPAIDDAMPPFEGTAAERQALAEYLALLPSHAPTGGVR
jgi:mono/diheme cytochrome c family protein